MANAEEKLRSLEKTREQEKFEEERIRRSTKKRLRDRKRNPTRPYRFNIEIQPSNKVDQLRRTISERDRRIDELVVEKARTEQQLIGQREMEEELEQRRSKEKELNDSVKSIERRIVELETENRLLDEKNKELTESKEKSEARAEESNKHSEELEKKAVRELQREVKQLYVELNEKTDALDMARTRISELESSSSKSVEEAVIQKQTHTDVDASPNYGVCTERFTDLTI
ncbi:hypothetical protein COOONC_10424 [Cooperia oncophora]